MINFLWYTTDNERGTDAVDNKKFAKKRIVTNCESCVYYDYDEDLDAYVCIRNLDEDEMERFLAGRNQSCPYYRFYDEYKSVHKQIWKRSRVISLLPLTENLSVQNFGSEMVSSGDLCYNGMGDSYE